MPIFRRKDCIHTASGIFPLCKRLHITQVESGLQSAEGMDFRPLCLFCVVQVAACATSRPLVQRRPTVCVCVCVGWWVGVGGCVYLHVIMEPQQ
jgi:hypothetical protein